MDVKQATDRELMQILTGAGCAHQEGPMNPLYQSAKETIREVGTELLERLRGYVHTARTAMDRDHARLGVRLMENRLAEL